VVDTLIRILQPFTPFLCEELWQRLMEIAPKRGLGNPVDVEEAAIVAQWPSIWVQWQDRPLERRFQRLQETIIAVRNVRAANNIPPATTISLLIRCSAEVAEDMQHVAGQFPNLAKAELTAVGPDVERPRASTSFSLPDADGFIPLAGVIDVNAELARQHAEAAKLRKHIAGHEAKLANEKFTAKAPADVVANVRETLANLKSQVESIEQIIRDLGGE
jgi:valyl-tRNA synthetase